MKKKMPWIAASALTVSGLLVGTASAVTYFSEDFQNQTSFPFGPPAVGALIDTSSSTGNPISLSTFPDPALPAATGGKSVKVGRPAGTDPVLALYGNSGAMVTGNTMEFSWNSYQADGGYNAPQQIGIGLPTGLVGRMIFLGVNDLPPAGGANDATYFYTDSSNHQINANRKPTINGWDKLRVVMSFEATPYPDYLTGTYDLFLTKDVLNGGTEEQLVNDLAMPYVQIPGSDDAGTPYDDRSSPFIRIARGPEGPLAGPAYFDNFLVQGTGAAIPTADANSDGKVNTLDFNILAGHFGFAGQTFADGDFSGDGLVDSVDFGILVAHYGESTVPGPLSVGSAVPEPTSITAVLGAAVFCLRRRNA